MRTQSGRNEKRKSIGMGTLVLPGNRPLSLPLRLHDDLSTAPRCRNQFH